MLPFRVFVKPQHRPDLAAAHPHPNSFSITLIQPLSFLTFTHSSAQRTTPIYFAFNHLHTLSTATEGVGGTPSPNLPTFPRVYDLSPLFSYHCALFCTFLHSQKTQPPCFQSFPHSASKNTRGGGTPVSCARPFRGDYHPPNQSPACPDLVGVTSHQPAPSISGSPALVLPSVPVDQLLDDHAVEFEECKRWANSEAGQSAHMTNPAGFANVRAHAEAHLRVVRAGAGN